MRLPEPSVPRARTRIPDATFLASRLHSCALQIPEAVIRYYLNRAGIDTDDHRLLRVVALAAHKFVSDVAHKSMQQVTLRHKRARTSDKGDKKASAGEHASEKTLLMQDLSEALREYGVRVSQPPDLYAAVEAEDAGEAAEARRQRAAGGDGVGRKRSAPG